MNAITLRDGPTVDEAAIDLFLSLTDRGFSVAATPRGRLAVEPDAALTPQDREGIRHHYNDLFACWAYCEVCE
jgi:hypothetical protein